MFDKETIKKNLKILQNSGYISQTVDDDFIDFQIDKAIEYGAITRGCSVDELKEDPTPFNSVLVSMTHSAINLQDKLGLTTASQNGVMNAYENGNIYQEEDIKKFIPRLRSIR